MTRKITMQIIYDVYESVPAADRHRAYWSMSRETLDQVADVCGAPSSRHVTYLLGRPIYVDDSAAGLSMVVSAKPDPLRLRAGTKVGRTLYRINADGSEDFIGAVDTPELAAQIVEAVNARP